MFAASMLDPLGAHAARYGLRLHLGNTQLLTNNVRTKGILALFDDIEVHIILPGASEKYFGRVVNAVEYHEAELTSRMSSGGNLVLHNSSMLWAPKRTPCQLYWCCSSLS
eukprot:8795847-Pyramimonas_sp.AAC.1